MPPLWATYMMGLALKRLTLVCRLRKEAKRRCSVGVSPLQRGEQGKCGRSGNLALFHPEGLTSHVHGWGYKWTLGREHILPHIAWLLQFLVQSSLHLTLLFGDITAPSESGIMIYTDDNPFPSWLGVVSSFCRCRPFKLLWQVLQSTNTSAERDRDSCEAGIHPPPTEVARDDDHVVVELWLGAHGNRPE